jgi:S1-C subfamily serine protease
LEKNPGNRAIGWGLLAAGVIGGMVGALAIFLLLGSRKPTDIDAEFSRAIAKARPAVVSIDIRYTPHGPGAVPGVPALGSASGIIIDGKKGLILTNSHVIKKWSDIQVRLEDGRKFKAKLMGQDGISDIAVLQIPAERLPAAVLGESRNLAVGSWVLAIGNPLLFEGSVTAGIVSGVGRSIGAPGAPVDLPDVIQTDAAINLGNSGGALVNLKGEVIGVPTAIYRGYGAEGMGFAVPIDRAKAVAKELLQYGHALHPWLGIRYGGLVPGDPLAGPAGNLGVVIYEVASGSPAEQAGLRKGDIIRYAAGKKLVRQEDFRDLMKTMKLDDTLSLVVERGGKRKTISVKIGNQPDVPLPEMFPDSFPKKPLAPPKTPAPLAKPSPRR